MVDASPHVSSLSSLHYPHTTPQLNFTTLPAAEGTRLSHLNMELHGLREDFSAVLAERELALTDGSAYKPYDSVADYLNNINTNAAYGPQYPLTPDELNYVSGGHKSPLDFRVQQYIAKIPPHVRNQLRIENKCFFCKNIGHMARDCPKSPVLPANAM